MRDLQRYKALIFLALAGLVAKANRDFCMARPTVCSGSSGRIVRFLHMHTEAAPHGRSGR